MALRFDSFSFSEFSVNKVETVSLEQDLFSLVKYGTP